MAGFSLSVTGPFGSEILPDDLPHEAVPEAAWLFAAVLSGEADLIRSIDEVRVADGATGPMPAPLMGAIVMLVERARRSVDHAPALEVADRGAAALFVLGEIEHCLGPSLSADCAYAAYVRWSEAGGKCRAPARPVGAQAFHRIISAHFERRPNVNGSIVYVDAVLRQEPA